MSVNGLYITIRVRRRWNFYLLFPVAFVLCRMGVDSEKLADFLSRRCMCFKIERSRVQQAQDEEAA